MEISHNYFSQIHLTFLHSGSGNAKGPFTPGISDQHCNDASNAAVIENNGVTLEWVFNSFSSDSIVFNENGIASVIKQFS